MGLGAVTAGIGKEVSGVVRIPAVVGPDTVVMVNAYGGRRMLIEVKPINKRAVRDIARPPPMPYALNPLFNHIASSIAKVKWKFACSCAKHDETGGDPWKRNRR